MVRIVTGLPREEWCKDERVEEVSERIVNVTVVKHRLVTELMCYAEEASKGQSLEPPVKEPEPRPREVNLP